MKERSKVVDGRARNARSRVQVAVTNQQSHVPCDAERLRQAVRHVFRESADRIVRVGVAVVDDATIHELNRRHLNHDYPTDVLSYPLEESSTELQGEIVVSAQTAQRSAAEYGWSPEDELCLYVVHGALHLAGYRDKSSAEIKAMRRAERDVLASLGIEIPQHDDS